MASKPEFGSQTGPITQPIGSTTQTISNATQALYLPARVIYEDDKGHVTQEIVRTNFISANRAIIPLATKLPIGMVVRLALPLPVSWRKHSFTETVYVTPAEVTSAEIEGDGFSTHFKYLSDKDAARRRAEYKARMQAGGLKGPIPQRRNDSRFEIPIEIRLELLDDFGNAVSTEYTVTDNISKGGARLRTSFKVQRGDFVRVIAERESFKARALIKNVFTGSDGMRRVNLQFLDATWTV